MKNKVLDGENKEELRTEKEIRPLSFKEEMKSPVSRIIFVVTTLWVVFSGIMTVLYIFGRAEIGSILRSVFLFSFAGGVVFAIKQIFKEKKL